MSDRSGALSVETKFELHFIASLLGAKRVHEHLAAPTKPAYWRTPLLQSPHDSDAQNATDLHRLETQKGKNDEDQFTVLFLDVSWIVGGGPGTSATHTTLHVGMLLQGRQGHVYARGILAARTIHQYFSDLGIDVETTEPEVMAHSLAKSFKDIKLCFAIPPPVEAMRLSLNHRDVQETATMVLELESTCKLDNPTLGMLLSNLRQIQQGEDDPTENKYSEYDATKLELTLIQLGRSQNPATPSPAKKRARHQEAKAAKQPRRGGGVIRPNKPKTLSYVSNK